MKKIGIVIVVLAIVAGIGWYAFQQKQNKSTEAPATPKNEPIAVVQDIPELPKEEPWSQSAFYVKPEENPLGWQGFYELSQMKKLNQVTEVMNSTDAVDPEVYAFFKAELFNRNHWDVTRNNMANALVWARDANNLHPDPDLHEAFITMLDDETEDPVWRDYCLQFLSENLKSSSDPKRVKDVITKYSKGDDSIAGTAMVHMALQERDGMMKLNETFNEQLAEQLEKPEVHRDTKLAIIGVMGKRKDIQHLPLIRKYAKQDENAGLKRVAIAALGTIGASPETASSITDEDKANVQAALKHKNRAVQMAAKGALKKLEVQ